MPQFATTTITLAARPATEAGLKSKSAMILGVPAAAGLAVGPAFLCHCDEVTVVPRHAVTEEELPLEMERFEGALSAAEDERLALQSEIQQRVSESEAAFFLRNARYCATPVSKGGGAAFTPRKGQYRSRRE